MAWNCEQCGNIVVEEHLALCTLCGAMRAGVGTAAVVADPRNPQGVPRDLKMEAHVGAIALWYRGFAIIVGVAIALRLLVAYLSPYRPPLVEILVTVAIVGGFCTGSFLVGNMLRRLSGRARLAVAILTGAGLLLNVAQMTSAFHGGYEVGRAFLGIIFSVFGIAWVAVVLAVLHSRRASRLFEDDYRALVEHTMELKAHVFGSPFFWIPLIVIGVCALLVFSLGMMLSGAR